MQGPPGTGKTHTLHAVLSGLHYYLKRLNKNSKIMVCAPSNTAVDYII